jgi:hypothetical protein
MIHFSLIVFFLDVLQNIAITMLSALILKQARWNLQIKTINRVIKSIAASIRNSNHFLAKYFNLTPLKIQLSINTFINQTNEQDDSLDAKQA